MRNRCRFTTFAARAALALVAACGDGGSSPEQPPEVRIRSASPSGRLEVGDTVRLTVEVRGAGGALVERPNLEFRSLTPDLAAIGAGPVIVALRSGTAAIEVLAVGPAPAVPRTVADTIRLTIDRIALTQVRIDTPRVALVAGDTLRLSATAITSRGQPLPGASFVWSSRQPDVATISRDGALQILRAGTATIETQLSTVPDIAEASATIVAQMKLTAGAATLGALTLRVPRSRMPIGAVDSVSAVAASTRDVVLPASIGWRSSDPTVLTVDSLGRLTARKRGTATIEASVKTSATFAPSNLVARATLTVFGATVATLSTGNNPSSLETGDTLQLRSTASDSAGRTLPAVFQWRALDPTIASVDSAGRVSARLPGLARFEVAVLPSDTLEPSALQSRIALTIRSVARIVEIQLPAQAASGDTIRPTAVARDRVGTLVPGVAFTWTGDAPLIAGVGQAGVVTPRARGTVRITATAAANGTTVPTPVSAVASLGVRAVFTRVVSGAFHSCAIARGGALHCWGTGAHGRLGVPVGLVPDTSHQLVAAPEAVNAFVSFVDASASGMHDSRSGHTCARDTLARTWCWGSGEWGNLGDGRVSTGTSLHAVRTPQLVPNVSATSVAVGSVYSCVAQPNGAVRCAGSNSVGLIGASPPPYACDEHCVSTFASIPGAPVISTLVAGGKHVCGLTPAGEAWCWGLNTGGQFGNGPYDVSPTPIRSGGGMRFTALAAGAQHTCGISTNGNTYCWGTGFAGQLGLGALGQSFPLLSPTRLALTAPLVSIASSMYHTCGLTAFGAAYCWGANESAQIGQTSSATCTNNLSRPCEALPIPVSAPVRFTQIAPGMQHTCALDTAGDVWCWGDNSLGQLGTGVSTPAVLPVRIRHTP